MRSQHFIMLIIIGLVAGVTQAQVPELIHYQGRLLEGTTLVNRDVELSIKLYNQPLNGDLLYEDSNTVTVVDGLYATDIGDDGVGSLMDALTNAYIYIQVDVDGTALMPRERMTSVGFALKADGVTTGSITTAMLADGAVTSEKIGAGEVKTVNIESGAVGSNELASAAVTTSHIAAGAVDTPQLADGAVMPAKLAKPYQSGAIVLHNYGQASNLYFDPYTTNIVVTFSPEFSSLPIVSLGLETGIESLADLANPYITGKTRSNFVVKVDIPLMSTVVNDAGGSQGVSLANVNGRPAMAYYSATDKLLKYSRAMNASGTIWGPAITIDPVSNRGYACSMAIIDGNPAVSYYDPMYDDLLYVRASNVNGTAWATPVIVATNGPVGYPNKLAEVNGYPAIAYHNNDGPTAMSVLYVRGSDAAGTAWETPIEVDTNGYPGWQGLSLVVVNGNPAIAYYEQTAGYDLLYMRASDQWGDTWPSSSVQVYTNGDVGKYCCMINISNYPAIAFKDSTESKLKYIVASDINGTIWGSDRTISTNAYVGAYLSIAEVNGRPVVACYESDNEDLVYFHAKYSNGSSWNDMVRIETNGNVGYHTSLIELSGVPAIGYYDYDNSNAKFIRSGNPPTNSFVNWIAVQP